MIKAISFDLDHTLYDRDATWEALVPSFTAVFKDVLSESMNVPDILQSLRDTDYRATYRETNWEGMYRYLVEDGTISERTGYERFIRYIYDYFPDATVAYDDTYEVLEWCGREGLHPSLITNGHPDLQIRKLNALSLANVFEEIIICDLAESDKCKPDKGAFLQLAEKLAVCPHEILYVGDNPLNDIEGARNAGMRTAWLNVMHNWNNRYAPADYEINKLRDLCDIIAEENQFKERRSET